MTFVRPDASRWDVPQPVPEKAPEKPTPDRWELEQAKRVQVREAAARLFAPVEGLLYEVLSAFLHGLVRGGAGVCGVGRGGSGSAQVGGYIRFIYGRLSSIPRALSVQV